MTLCNQVIFQKAPQNQELAMNFRKQHYEVELQNNDINKRKHCILKPLSVPFLGQLAAIISNKKCPE